MCVLLVQPVPVGVAWLTHLASLLSLQKNDQFLKLSLTHRTGGCLHWWSQEMKRWLDSIQNLCPMNHQIQMMPSLLFAT